MPVALAVPLALSMGVYAAMGTDSNTFNKDAAIAAGKVAQSLTPGELQRAMTRREGRDVDSAIGVTAGNSTAVSALRDSVPAMVSQYLNLQDLPQDPSQRNASVASDRATQVMRGLFDESVLDAKTADLIRGIASRAADPNMEMMQAVDLIHIRWNRIAVTDGSATTVFTAQTRRLTSQHGWVDESDKQFKLQLVPVGPGWRITDLQIINLGGEG